MEQPVPIAIIKPLIWHYPAAAPTHAGADRVPHMIKQVDIEITAKDVESIILAGDSYTLSRGFPGYTIVVCT